MKWEEQLCLVPAQVELAQALAAYYVRNRAFLAPYEPAREEAFFTAEYQKNVLQGETVARAEGRGYRFYIQRRNAPEEIIGTIGLNNVVWGAFCSAHLGYKLDEGFLNRGIMTWAVGEVTRFAFEQAGLHRVEANVMPRNGASLRVLEKNGYENEGLSRFYLNINGVWEDHIHMVKLNQAMHPAP